MLKKFSEAVQDVLEDENLGATGAAGAEAEEEDVPPSMQLYAGEGTKILTLLL